VTGDLDANEWYRQGWVVLCNVLNQNEVTRIRASVDEIAAWAEDDRGLHHFEQTDAGPVLARSERFADEHDYLGGFIRRGPMTNWLAELFGEPAVLFKEKINYKHPGGGGFAPHQDAAAYRFVDHHISAMVPVDHATVASGCLHFAPGFERGRMATDDRGRLMPEVVEELRWSAVELGPGDVVLFDSYTPHFSDANRSGGSRRALYLTYNAASRGDFRARYYEDKEAELTRAGESFDGERVRISISDDFLGRPVGG